MFDFEQYYGHQPIVRIKHADEARRCCHYFMDVARKRGGTLAAVVKSDGYGFGVPNIMPPILDAGISQIYTSDISEAVAIRDAGFRGRLFTLNGFFKEWGRDFDEYQVIPVLSSRQQTEDFAAFSAQLAQRKCASIHFDTGMNRNGLPPDDVLWLQENWNALAETINIDHYLTHLHSVEQALKAEQRESLKQISCFRSYIKMLPHKSVSILATDGTLYLDPKETEDFPGQIYRIGSGLVGQIYDNPYAVSIYARINEVRSVKKGSKIGYDQIFEAEKDMRVAVVEIGYGDGYTRSLNVTNQSALLPNAPFMLIDGQRCSVVGKISMNMTTLDVSALPFSTLKSRFAEVVGPNADVRVLASYAGTIPEELLIALQAPNRRAKDFILA